MFSDPLVALMLMVMLCFIGMLVMFLFVIRAITNHSQGLRESERRVGLVLTELERQLLDLSFALRQKGTGEKNENSGATNSIPGLTSDADLGALLSNISTDGASQEPMADQHLIPGMENLPSLDDRGAVNGKRGSSKGLEINID